ncbi:hypothetical protein A3K86_15295 [Photobacterium jeanii]|uniref:DUF2059 domain-containing protein n=1 Tax=Photobacterium jeanii TaxID=858640 RepID=A0A178K6S6_9GAMM|nr:DUF2059 domain-containing protein [Photobacterium jeanii]OAN13030.1 hypothetical protein A3K86_15295 [Photobacterium jeanii]PST89178.1 DUF2059 domain-containing protein [Photobacterium jeanii]
MKKSLAVILFMLFSAVANADVDQDVEWVVRAIYNEQTIAALNEQATVQSVHSMIPIIENNLDRKLSQAEQIRLYTFWFERIEKIVTADAMVSVVAPVLKQQFSESEIKQLKEFYTSPIGSKWVAATPEIMNQMQTSTMSYVSATLKDSDFLESFKSNFESEFPGWL